MWFKQLTGFEEKSPEFVRQNLAIQGDCLYSKANNQKFCFGQLDIPTLQYLRERTDLEKYKAEKISVREVIANVKELHSNPENANAVFQAASQFNLLEMISPEITPEAGVDRYEMDYTQGPACAIACGAGTIYRNYFVEVNKQIGQTSTHQIDCLELIGNALNNEEFNLWSMKNGYALANQNGLHIINEKLVSLTNKQWEELKGKLKIGIQWNTEVTISEEKHRVTQVYCSALPVAYSHIDPSSWERFARLILEATYEATLYAALINYNKTKSNKVFLTLVGGGVFGNQKSWILESLEKAIHKFKNSPLDVRIVSYSRSNSELRSCIDKITSL